MHLKNCLFILFLFFFISCKEKESNITSNNSSLKQPKSCSCGDLILDQLYNHFYLNDRTIPFTGTCIDYHKNGEIFQKKEFTKGKMDGVFLEYSNKSILIKKWNFSKNKRVGESMTYNSSGKLIFHGIYKNGKLDSTVLSF